MTSTLFEAVQKIGDMLGGTRTGKATGGSTTTIVDTRRFEADDAFNQGTALLVDNSEWSVISDFVQSSGTVTLYDAVTSVGVGDNYKLIIPKYPLDEIISKINQVLMGERVANIDIASLDMTSEQAEYTLPAGIDRSNLRQVWVQTNDDTNKYEWMRCANWRVEQNGTTHTLIFDNRAGRSIDNALNGYAIKLVSTPYHDDVSETTDTIDDLIHLDRLLYPTLELLLFDDMSKNIGDKWLANRMNWVMDMKEKTYKKHPVHLPEWHEHGSGW